MRSLNKTLLIICEGQNTEPLLFGSIRDKILENKFPVVSVNITIKPEPIDESIDEKKSATSFKQVRPKREVNKAIGSEPQEISGVPPLKWVLAAQEDLREGTYDEIWVVFDHDDHPARQEAFQRADEEIDGKKINIAFSSRSFEYYLLLNFEKIYQTFQKTDCKDELRKVINCGTAKHANDCDGKICINGYAYKNKYWTKSKSGESIYPLIENKLEQGFENSIWLRIQSDIHQGATPIYDRNPYTNVDELMKRLIGSKWHLLKSGLNLQLGNILLELNGTICKLVNNSKISDIVTANSFTVVSKNKRTYLGQRKFLNPGESYSIDFSTFGIKNIIYCIFKHDNQNVMF